MASILPEGATPAAAFALRSEGNPSFLAIGRLLGVSEATANRLYLVGKAEAEGRTITRAPDGRLLPETLARLREMIMAGATGTEIIAETGVSGGRISHERRLMAADGMNVPPPGGGRAYSGRKLSPEIRAKVEQLVEKGVPATQIAKRTGVGHTHVQRIRERVMDRLNAAGIKVPGCDERGVRKKHPVSKIRQVPKAAVLEFERLLLNERTPVNRAALRLGIGSSKAYQLRDALAARLAKEGRSIPEPLRLGRNKAKRSPDRWLPIGRRYLTRFRELTHKHGLTKARDLMQAELKAETAAQNLKRQQAAAERRRQAEERARIRKEVAAAAECAKAAAAADLVHRKQLVEAELARYRTPPRPRLTYEEQLAAARNGTRIVTIVPLVAPDSYGTLGGVATGQLI